MLSTDFPIIFRVIFYAYLPLRLEEENVNIYN